MIQEMGRISAARRSIESGDLNPGNFLSRDRRAKRATFRILAITVAATMIFACSGTQSSGSPIATAESSAAPSAAAPSESGIAQEVVFGFSHPFADVPVVQSVDRIVKANAERHGWTVFLDETQAGNLQDQLAVLDTWITQGVDAMNVFPTQPSSYEAIARRAEEAGIIWTTYVNPMEAGAGGIGLPAAPSGEITGRATVDWIKANDPDAEVLIITVPQLPEAQDRVLVPKQMIEDETDATIVSEQSAQEQAEGLRVTEAALQANPNISVVVAFNDDAALGAAEAFRQQGTRQPDEVWIVGQDGAQDALEALKDPTSYFRASAALDIGKLCEEVVELTKRALDKGWKPGDEQEVLELAPTILTHDTQDLVDEFLSVYTG